MNLWKNESGVLGSKGNENMTDIDSKFKLWSVGQGLFYTGKIKHESITNSFQFMYDCGGSKKGIISKEIDEYLNCFNQKNEIDMLVISHFDNDHINGLPHLLKKVNKIKKIFIPYYYNLSSYLLLVAYIYGNGGDLSSKVDNIFLVRPSRHEGEERQYDIDELGIEDEIDETYRIGNISVSKIDLSSCISLRGVWKFKFYNTLLKEETSIGKVKKDIDSLIKQHNSVGLEDLLSNHWDDSVKKGLKTIYDSNVPVNSVTKKFKNSSQNQASLCLYHSTLIRNKYSKMIFKQNRMNDCSLFYKDRCCLNFLCRSIENIGTMLTGDISLRSEDQKSKQKYEHFCEYFASEKNNTVIFLVPHHGSSNNWNPNIPVDFKNINFFINSAGLDNRHKHPDGNVIKDILSTGANFLWANEKNWVEYCINYFE